MLTLRGEVKQWANSLKEEEAITWDSLIVKFMKKFLLPLENARSRQDLMTFEQRDSENLIDAWRRFKRIIKRCPQHCIHGCILMEQLYFELRDDT